jgi:hypothetical protein
LLSFKEIYNYFVFVSYPSAFVAGDAFPIVWPFGIVPLLLPIVLDSSLSSIVVVLKVRFFRLNHIGHIVSWQVALRVVSISIQSAIVTVLILHRLIQVVVDKVELRWLFADVILSNGHADEMNLWNEQV